MFVGGLESGTRLGRAGAATGRGIQIGAAAALVLLTAGEDLGRVPYYAHDAPHESVDGAGRIVLAQRGRGIVLRDPEV